MTAHMSESFGRSKRKSEKRSRDSRFAGGKERRDLLSFPALNSEWEDLGEKYPIGACLRFSILGENRNIFQTTAATIS